MMLKRFEKPLSSKSTLPTISVIAVTESTPDLTTASASSPVPALVETLTAALSVRTKLLEIGPYITSIQDDMSRLASHINQYWRSLESLSSRLNSSTAVHNARALSLITTILSHTHSAFSTITAHLPPTGAIGSSGSATSLFFAKHRLKRSWRKLSVNDLLRRLDVLDSVVQLLLLVLTIGEKVRWCRAFVRGGNSNKVVYETLKLQHRHAKAYLAEQVLLTAGILTDGDYGIGKDVPVCLGRVVTDLAVADEGWDESEYTGRNLRGWWDGLLREWTGIL